MIPKHVAIIPDGNRRWAKKRGIPISLVYKISGDYQRAKKKAEEAKKLGIKCLSIWAFSTENWKRDEKEIKSTFETINNFLDLMIKNVKDDKIGFRWIGRSDRIPKNTLKKLIELEAKTKKYRTFTLVLGIDYGGRDELIRSINKAIQNKKTINEKSFQNFLDTKNLPDPDLIIRTGGEKRLSGLMPFQATYAELYFTDKFFPEFEIEDLKKAVKDFENRKRNFGK
jgi:undecaprenyl diphosphate synthase